MWEGSVPFFFRVDCSQSRSDHRFCLRLSVQPKNQRQHHAHHLCPHDVAPVAAGVFFRFVYDQLGSTQLFHKSCGTRISFWRSFAVMWAVQWWMCGCGAVHDPVCLAGLQAVPKHLIEATQIDRVPWTMRFRNVVLPHIKPVLVLAILLRTIDAFKTFDTIFVMTGGGPGTATEVLPMTLYRTAFLYFQTGTASSYAVIVLFMAVAFTSVYLLASKREG